MGNRKRSGGGERRQRKSHRTHKKGKKEENMLQLVEMEGKMTENGCIEIPAVV